MQHEEYDVWAHAAALGVHVMTGVLPAGHWGEYRSDEHVIVLAHNLSEQQQRCTLAHELVHAERRERPTEDGVLRARQERRADRIAAGRLIDWADYAEACRTHAHEKQPVARELGVTRHMLRAYEQDLLERPARRAGT